ncbi:MAG: hypothetical protein U0R19_29255 [Bryobacteraceae bacterium]
MFEGLNITGLRSEFYFGINKLLVNNAVLGKCIRFVRDGFEFEILFPVDYLHFARVVKDGALGERWGSDAIEVQVVRISVIGPARPSGGDLGQDDPYADYLLATFDLAEAAIRDLVELMRTRGQPWLALHGERPRHVGYGSVDGALGWADFCESWLRGKQPEPWQPPPDSLTKSVALADLMTLGDLLSSARGVALAERLLADAEHHPAGIPANRQYSVLMAAIACEVKVKDTLRSGSSSASPRDRGGVASLFDKAMMALMGRSLRLEDRDLYKRVDRLYQLRNRIAHVGEIPCEATTREAIDTARSAFEWLNSFRSNQPGE